MHTNTVIGKRRKKSLRLGLQYIPRFESQLGTGFRGLSLSLQTEAAGVPNNLKKI
jgi:hypothetical protein